MKNYEHYATALASLRRAPGWDLGDDATRLRVIDGFASQFRLSRELFEVLLAYEGDPAFACGSTKAMLEAASRYYDFMDGVLWLDMLRDCKAVPRMVAADTTSRLTDSIVGEYIPEFERVNRGLRDRYGDRLVGKRG